MRVKGGRPPQEGWEFPNPNRREIEMLHLRLSMRPLNPPSQDLQVANSIITGKQTNRILVNQRTPQALNFRHLDLLKRIRKKESITRKHQVVLNKHQGVFNKHRWLTPGLLKITFLSQPAYLFTPIPIKVTKEALLTINSRLP